MSIEYADIFIKHERFLFQCSECFALVFPGNHEFHTDYHEREKRKNYVFER